MNADDQDLVALIRRTLPRLSEPPPVDLWSRLELQLDEGRTAVGRLDRLMAALVLGLLAAFPEVATWVLYHL